MNEIKIFLMENETEYRVDGEWWFRELEKEYNLKIETEMYNPRGVDSFQAKLEKALNADIIIIDYGGLGKYGFGNNFVLIRTVSEILLKYIRDYPKKFWFIVSGVFSYLDDEDKAEFEKAGVRFIDYYNVEPFERIFQILSLRKKEEKEV